jgi:hypothetical protein
MNTTAQGLPILFDDFLGLGGTDLRQAQLIVLTGVSGSGKSTALKFLCDQHPAFSDEPHQWIWAPGKNPDPAPFRDKRLVVVDEVCHPRQLPFIARLLKQNQAVAVASHLNPAWFLPLRLAWRIHHFRTDRDPAKISRYLCRLGVPHTAGAVAEFCRLYGASYLDLDCILERYPGKSLDQALHLSLKLDHLAHLQAEKFPPVMPVIQAGPAGKEPGELQPHISKTREQECQSSP